MAAARDPTSDRQGGASMHRQLIIAAAGGLVSAVLSLGLLTGSSSAVLFAYFAPLPIMLIGLSTGLMSVSAAILLAAVLVVNLAGGAQAAIYLASIALPAWLISRYAVTARRRRRFAAAVGGGDGDGQHRGRP
jgi:hypothetical protein